MYKRLMIVITIIIAVVFVPYFLGMLPIFKNDTVSMKWIGGFLTLVAAIMSFFITSAILQAIWNYIVHNERL